MVTRPTADYLQQDVAVQQWAIPQATAVPFPCPVKFFLWAKHLINSLAHLLLLSCACILCCLIRCEITQYSPLTMTCPHLLTSIQPLLTKFSGTITICEIFYPSVRFSWNWPTSSSALWSARHALKDHTSLISLGNNAKNPSLPLIQILSYCSYSLRSTQK